MSTLCAVITGFSGQDATYLAELLLSRGYHIIGVSRSLDGVKPGDSDGPVLRLAADLSDRSDVERLFQRLSKESFERDISCLEFYHLAAASSVFESFIEPSKSFSSTVTSVCNILECLREHMKRCCPVKFFHAGSSEMFGQPETYPQNENTLFKPRSPYAVGKLAAYNLVSIYREAYGMHVCSGILFNHESPLRPEKFVTRKITMGAMRWKTGSREPIRLGNLAAERDWGAAKDYVRGMYLMMQQERPDDYIIATGKTHSVEDFVSAAFKCVGVQVAWEGEGLGRVGYDANTQEPLCVVDSEFFRPLEPGGLCGDCSKLEKLGWVREYSFEGMVAEMVHSDMERADAEAQRAMMGAGALETPPR